MSDPYEQPQPGAHYHRTPAITANFWMMRLLPWAPIRRALGGALAGYIRAIRPSAGLPEDSPALAGAAEELRRSGIASIPPVYSPSQLDDVRTYLAEQELVSRPGGLRFRASEAPPEVGLASYPLAVVARCPHVADLMNRPELLAIARRYLGCTPTIAQLGLDWSAPSSNEPWSVQRFHRDYDDWRVLKLFVYLTDVDEGSGPHEYVLGSHRDSGRIRALPYSAEDIDRRYGAQGRRQVLGPRGTSFLADTWGIHKGNVPTSRPRLMLQVQYSVLPVFRFAYEPVPVPQADRYDRYVNRLILAPGGGAESAPFAQDQAKNQVRP
ncbi:MAG: phytanoyl-CoA dioxygenase family protein [Myxococcales bacterium]